MSPTDLSKYRSKRNFARTREPAGAEPAASGNLFMVHKHDATRLHYDLRLQVGDVLKSWAVPRGPSLDPAERRLAVQVEDHPLEYGSFEGVIPQGQYGAGPTLVWDSGTWAPMEEIEKSLQSGTLKFRLAGEKLKGGWTLTRLKRRQGETRDNWLLIKEHDDAATPDVDILEARPESVLSGRKVEELVVEDKPAKPQQLRPGALAGAVRAEIPRSHRPQLATAVAEPPDGDDWIHEIKFDGYRTIAIVERGSARLLTRNGHDWTSRYGGLAQAFEGLGRASAVIDGEVVVLDDQGVSHFADLQDALANGESWRFVFFAFDLVHLNGWDLSRVALIRRKRLLERLLAPLAGPASAIQLSTHVEGRGTAFFDRTCELGLEGVVSKRPDSPYYRGRSKTWLKAKAKRVGTFAIVGYTTSPQAGGLAALLLGESEGGELRYRGKAGTGFSADQAPALLERLRALERAEPALDLPTPAPKAVWVSPELRARVQYSNLTREGALRQAVFRGLREIEHAGGAAPARRYITDEHLASIWVTNPERRMFSRNGPTKLDLAVYYARVGDFMLPHILERPVSLVRCPTGKVDDCFFQRHAFQGMPAEVGVFVSEREDKEDREYLVVKDAAGFLALAQFGVVEFHPWGCRTDRPERPDRMFFDLDPGPGIAWREIVAAAHMVREELDRLDLVAFVKTSGGKGIHAVVPLKRLYSWDHVHKASGRIAASLAGRYPSTFTAAMARERRKTRIFIDIHRNARTATAAAAYSLRTRPGLPASAPVGWDELESIDDPQDLNYASLPRLVGARGDPWADLDDRACTLGKEVMAKIAR